MAKLHFGLPCALNGAEGSSCSEGSTGEVSNHDLWDSQLIFWGPHFSPFPPRFH